MMFIQERRRKNGRPGGWPDYETNADGADANAGPLRSFWEACMGRWKTVFRSARKRVLVREGDGRDGKEWSEWALMAGLAALAVYMVWVVVSRFWPWLLVVGAVYAAVVWLPGVKKRLR